MNNNLSKINLYRLRAVSLSSLRKWGACHQINKCKEELLELLTELNNFDMGKSTDDKIIDEIVDVVITCSHLVVLMGLDKAIERFDFKLNRLDKLITGGKKHSRL